MTRLLMIVALLGTGCVAAPQSRVGLPGSLMSEDRGDLSGVWRPIRPAGLGYLLTIDQSIGTFAVQKGCIATGGVLRPMGGNRYAIEHYTSGHAVAGCGPWQIHRDLAPFDGRELTLVRAVKRLTASAGGTAVVFERVVRR